MSRIFNYCGCNGSASFVHIFAEDRQKLFLFLLEGLDGLILWEQVLDQTESFRFVFSWFKYFNWMANRTVGYKLQMFMYLNF